MLLQLLLVGCMEMLKEVKGTGKRKKDSVAACKESEVASETARRTGAAVVAAEEAME